MDIAAQLKNEWLREDRTYLAYLQKTLPEFEALYLKYFHKPLYRQINRMVIEDIVTDIARLKEQLFPVKSNVVYRIISNREVKDGFESNRNTANSRSLVGSMA